MLKYKIYTISINSNTQRDAEFLGTGKVILAEILIHLYSLLRHIAILSEQVIKGASYVIREFIQQYKVMT